MGTTNLETMTLEITGNLAVITLTRESSLNAMNKAFCDDFVTLVRAASDNGNIRAIIITGTGNGFSVGADLKSLPIEQDRDLSKALRENFEPMIRALKNAPFPTIAAVNGYSAGAGMGLMLACDFTIAARSAQFIQAFINIGLIPDMGCTFFLPRLVGRARAAAMMMLGETVSAEEALKMGLIYKLSDDDNLLDDAHKLAGKLIQLPTSALVEIRKLLDQSMENTFEEQFQAEAEAQKQAGLSENFEEGVRAFNEKRPPNFK